MRLRDIEASSDLGANRARYLGLLASIARLQAEAEGRQDVDFPDEVKKEAADSVKEEMNAFRANMLQMPRADERAEKTAGAAREQELE